MIHFFLKLMKRNHQPVATATQEIQLKESHKGSPFAQSTWKSETMNKKNIIFVLKYERNAPSSDTYCLTFLVIKDK